MPKTFGQLPRTKFTPPKHERRAFIPEKKTEPPFTGQVQGLRAAEAEERFARTLNKGIAKGIVREYAFRWTTMRRGTVGFKELDNLITKTNGEVVALMFTEETFVHKGERAANQDKLNRLIILSALRNYGYNVSEIVVVLNSKLKTQEESDKQGKLLGVYR